jgi:hypothetical protein
VGQYVVFIYQNELFPGKMISYDDKGATVSSMKRSLKSWKWPEKEDIKTFSWEDILGSIIPPKQISSRGLFDTPELKMISYIFFRSGKLFQFAYVIVTITLISAVNVHVPKYKIWRSKVQ